MVFLIAAKNHGAHGQQEDLEERQVLSIGTREARPHSFREGGWGKCGALEMPKGNDRAQSIIPVGMRTEHANGNCLLRLFDRPESAAH